MEATPTRVVCIGAGPAGLTAAYHLGKSGVQVTVLERDPIHVGGISRTETYRSFRFDVGAESSQYWSSMAVAVIFGLAMATLLTLVVVPVLTSLAESLKGRFSRKPA